VASEGRQQHLVVASGKKSTCSGKEKNCHSGKKLKNNQCEEVGGGRIIMVTEKINLQ